jgi:hypothetical protein
MGYSNPFASTNTTYQPYQSAQQQANTYNNPLGNNPTTSTGWRPPTTSTTSYSGQGGGAISTNPYGTYNRSLPGTYNPSTGSYGGITMSDYQGPPGGGPASNPGTTWDNYPGSQQQQPQYDPNDPSIDFIDNNGQPHYNPQYGQDNNNNTHSTPAPQTSGEYGGYPTPGQNTPNPSTTPNIPGMQYPMPNIVMPGQQQPTTGQPGATGQPGWGTPWTYQQWMAMSPEDQTKANNYMAIQAQMGQGGQNAYQYNQDYNAAQTRWAAEFGRGVTQDQYQMGLSDRQLQEQIRQADLAQGNWSNEYNFNTGMANRQLGNQQYEFGQNMQLQQGQLNLATLSQQQQHDIATGRLTLDQVAQQQNNALGQGRLSLDTLSQQQRHQIETGQLTLAQVAQQQNNAIAQGRLASDTQQWQGAQGIDRFRAQNDLTLGQRGLDIQGLQANNQNAQFYAGQNQQNQQFGQTLAFERQRNAEQYGLAVTNQQLEAELGRGRLASDTQQWQGAQGIQRQGQQMQDAQYYAGLGQANSQFGRQMNLEELQANRSFGINSRAQSLAERSQTEDTGFKYANLQQAAQMEAARQGVDVMQIMNTKEYQDAQTQIEREKLAQQGGLGGRELDIRQFETMAQQQYQQQQLAQQFQIEQMRLAAQKEQAALQSTGRLRAPKSRWLRSS